MAYGGSQARGQIGAMELLAFIISWKLTAENSVGSCLANEEMTCSLMCSLHVKQERKTLEGNYG